MKLISLNTWGGKAFRPLIDFIKLQTKDTDIFCLQEVYDTSSDIKDHPKIKPNLLEELKVVLSDFQVFYCPTLYGFDDQPEPVDFDLRYGLGVFIRKNIKVNSYNFKFIYLDGPAHEIDKDFAKLPTAMQTVEIEKAGKCYLICNFHGISFPGSKLDTPIRLAQSKKLLDIIEKYEIKNRILCGDFNLLPDTQSIQILEKKMRDLIQEYSVEITRSKLSPFWGRPDFQKYADYTFVSANIKVESFEVPETAASDHLPMILQFS